MRAMALTAMLLTAGFLAAPRSAPSGSATVGCATVSAGAASDALGLIINVGQPMIGGASGGGVHVHMGIVGCLGFDSAPSPPCPWDLDGSGTAGITDLLGLLAAWGPAPGHPADFDEDGVVGITDLLDLLAHWGPCPA